MKAELSASEGRRIALTAQGFNAWRRPHEIGVAKLRKTIELLGALQIDSVNVLVRAHYLPLFSGLGSYNRALLDAVASAKSKRFFEYWGTRRRFCLLTASPFRAGACPAHFTAKAFGASSNPLQGRGGVRRPNRFLLS